MSVLESSSTFKQIFHSNKGSLQKRIRKKDILKKVSKKGT